jgi:hypothetical protein
MHTVFVVRGVGLQVAIPPSTTVVLTDSIALAGHTSEISNKSATIGSGTNRFTQHDVKFDAEEGQTDTALTPTVSTSYRDITSNHHRLDTKSYCDRQLTSRRRSGSTLETSMFKNGSSLCECNSGEGL